MSAFPPVFCTHFYADGFVGLDWHSRAFGVRERRRRLRPDGRLSHGEVVAGDGGMMLATPSPDYQGPKKHRENCAAANRWSQVPYIIDGVLVYVPDVRAHYRRAKQAGARILSEPEGDAPGLRYRAEDLEGHRWMFMERF